MPGFFPTPETKKNAIYIATLLLVADVAFGLRLNIETKAGLVLFLFVMTANKMLECLAPLENENRGRGPAGP